MGPSGSGGVVPGPVPRLVRAVLGPLPLLGDQGAAAVRPAESPAEALAAAVAAAAKGAVSGAVTQGGRDGRQILRSWLSSATTFANPSNTA